MSKKNDDLRKELDALRAQVAALSAAQKEASAGPAPAESRRSPPAAGGDAIDFEGLLDSLKADLDAMPARTAIGVFALGLLVGRLVGN